MTTIINIGDDSADPADDEITLDVPPGATVNVAVTGSTVNYWLNQPDDNAATGTIANNANQNFTVPGWLTSNGQSTLTITGGNY